MKPIFLYTCHRQFIKDRCTVIKKCLCYVSNKYITNKLGQKSTQAFYRILRGTMKISDSNIMKIVDIFKLDTLEALYFTILVHLNQAETLLEKVYSTNKILNFIQTNPLLFSYNRCQFFIINHYVPLMKALSQDHDAYYDDLKTFLLEPECVSRIKHAVLSEQKRNIKNNSRVNGKTHSLLAGLGETIIHDVKQPGNRNSLMHWGDQD